MRIKSDMEFVKKACESDYSIGWDDSMEYRCGEKVTEVVVLTDTKVKCTFSDGEWWTYPSSCLTEDAMLEKGKKYTVNGSTDYFEFIEESENFAIFEGGIAFKKDGNEFVEVEPETMFLKRKWNVEVNSTYVIVRCDDFSVAMFTRDGCDMIGGLPKSLGFTLDENDAVNVIK